MPFVGAALTGGNSTREIPKTIKMFLIQMNLQLGQGGGQDNQDVLDSDEPPIGTGWGAARNVRHVRQVRPRVEGKVLGGWGSTSNVRPRVEVVPPPDNA